MGTRGDAARKIMRGMESPEFDMDFEIPDGAEADETIKANVDASGSGPSNAGTESQTQEFARSMGKAINEFKMKKELEKRTSGDVKGEGNVPDDTENPPKNEYFPD